MNPYLKRSQAIWLLKYIRLFAGWCISSAIEGSRDLIAPCLICLTPIFSRT
jgi:hypothetical protein